MNDIIREDVDYILRKLSPNDREKLAGATVLITGCAGFLGYMLMHFLATHRQTLGIERIVGLDNFMLGRPKWIDELMRDSDVVTAHQFNIISDDISKIENAARATHVMHLASIASPTYYRQYPIETLDANVGGLRRLLDYYVHVGESLKGLLFMSSSEIYGDPTADQIPTNEEYRGNVSCTGPRACYDEAKRFGETLCYVFAQKYNLPIVIARPFNNYGPGMRLNDKRVPADFAKAILENRDIEILSDGTPTRTFCYVADAITGYIKTLLHGRYDYFNIGIDRPEISMSELARVYVETSQHLFGYKGRVILAKSTDPAYLVDNPNRRCPNIDKAKNKLGFAPEIVVEAGVSRFLKFLSNNQ
jgi:UDP-glucuronate decarboxylase